MKIRKKGYWSCTQWYKPVWITGTVCLLGKRFSPPLKNMGFLTKQISNNKWLYSLLPFIVLPNLCGFPPSSISEHILITKEHKRWVPGWHLLPHKCKYKHSSNYDHFWYFIPIRWAAISFKKLGGCIKNLLGLGETTTKIETLANRNTHWNLILKFKGFRF